MTEYPVDPRPLNHAINLGLDTFGDVHTDSAGTRLSDAQIIRNLVGEGVLAEETGVDHFGIGEHHTESFPLSAGDVVLAAIAARTSRIRLAPRSRSSVPMTLSGSSSVFQPGQPCTD
jgi:hypothetical protein